MAIPAIFLDRDGVIIENRPNYVRSLAEVELIEPAIEALAAIAQLPNPVIIVTNQSAIGRNLITKSEADKINEWVVEKIKEMNGRIDAVYMCPHAPEANCECRKPKPELLLQAAREMNIDLARSIMVGDALTDIQAGRNAGISQTFLLLTGRGKEQLALPQADDLAPLKVFSDLKALFEDISDPISSLF